MKRILQISNGIAFFSMVIINYLSNTGLMNDNTIGEISDSINSLFTPASYAFAIWGLIYLLIFGFVVYQGMTLFGKKNNNDFVLNTSWWFVYSCLANIAWIFSWIYGYIGVSCFCIFLLLLFLLKIVRNNDMEIWDAPIDVIVFLWWPFVIYSGWITVAVIVNIAAYLESIGWNGFGFSEVFWSIVMISIATLINLLITWRRNMREFALVGAWALIGIAIANKTDYSPIYYFAIVAASILVLSSSIHGFRNRDTNPFLKFKQYISDRN